MPETVKKTTKQVADEMANVNETAKTEAQKNTITSRFNKTETFKTNEGEEGEQTWLIQFPGTAAASDLLDASSNPFGNINRTYFMQQAIKSIVVAPKIKDISWFDTHKGYTEVYAHVLSFLQDELN